MSTVNTLSDVEIQQLLDWIRPDNFYSIPDYKSARLKLAVLIMLDTGLRVGELVQLCWIDLYDQNNVLPVLNLTASIAKTKIPRQIPITERLKLQIQRFASLCFDVRVDKPYLFIFPDFKNSRPLSTRHLSRSIKNAALKAIGRPITAHCLRHTFATRLLRHTSTRVVQELLGHKSLQSTQIYTHPNSQDLRKAIDKL